MNKLGRGRTLPALLVMLVALVTAAVASAATAAAPVNTAPPTI